VYGSFRFVITRLLLLLLLLPLFCSQNLVDAVVPLDG
jgi:hypothetical protein